MILQTQLRMSHSSIPRTEFADSNNGHFWLQSTMEAQPAMETRVAAYNWATSAAFGRGGGGPPKVLGDLLESVAGAVYVDCSFDLEAAWKVGPMLVLAPHTHEYNQDPVPSGSLPRSWPDRHGSIPILNLCCSIMLQRLHVASTRPS